MNEKEDGSNLERDNGESPENVLDLKYFIKNPDKLRRKILEINEEAIRQVKLDNPKEALILLQGGEKILDFAACCGKSLDRNLIIITLYNSACVYQSLWILDKCGAYLEGAIFNLLSFIDDDIENLTSSRKSDEQEEFRAMKMKKMKFLVQSYLQYCAILSQQGQHSKALEIAKKTSLYLKEIFLDCQETVNSLQRSFDSQSIFSSSNLSLLKSKSSKTKRINKLNNESCDQNQKTNSEVVFSKMLIDFSFPIISDILSIGDFLAVSSSSGKHFFELRKALYYWRNNPEKNELMIKKELKSSSESAKTGNFQGRNMLGVADTTDWIESFNIGSIMHMTPISFEEFTFISDMNYEISRKLILEKLIYLSICFFTISTETRFMEATKLKIERNGDGFSESEFFHLRSIELACKYIDNKCPFVQHLINSYHKHYNLTLGIIPEESFVSQNSIGQEETAFYYQQSFVSRLTVGEQKGKEVFGRDSDHDSIFKDKAREGDTAVLCARPESFQKKSRANITQTKIQALNVLLNLSNTELISDTFSKKSPLNRTKSTNEESSSSKLQSKVSEPAFQGRDGGIFAKRKSSPLISNKIECLERSLVNKRNKSFKEHSECQTERTHYISKKPKGVSKNSSLGKNPTHPSRTPDHNSSNISKGVRGQSPINEEGFLSHREFSRVQSATTHTANHAAKTLGEKPKLSENLSYLNKTVSKTFNASTKVPGLLNMSLSQQAKTKKKVHGTEFQFKKINYESILKNSDPSANKGSKAKFNNGSSWKTGLSEEIKNIFKDVNSKKLAKSPASSQSKNKENNPLKSAVGKKVPPLQLSKMEHFSRNDW